MQNKEVGVRERCPRNLRMPLQSGWRWCVGAAVVHWEEGKSLTGQLHLNYLQILGSGSLKAFGSGQVPCFPHQVMARTVAHGPLSWLPWRISVKQRSCPPYAVCPVQYQKSENPSPACLHCDLPCQPRRRWQKKQCAELPVTAGPPGSGRAAVSSATSVKTTKKGI